MTRAEKQAWGLRASSSPEYIGSVWCGFLADLRHFFARWYNKLRLQTNPFLWPNTKIEIKIKDDTTQKSKIKDDTYCSTIMRHHSELKSEVSYVISSLTSSARATTKTSTQSTSLFVSSSHLVLLNIERKKGNDVAKTPIHDGLWEYHSPRQLISSILSTFIGRTWWLVS